MQIVRWYQEVMEEGLDTKQILKYYRASKKKIDDLYKEMELNKKKANRAQEKLQRKLKETRIYLKRLYNELVKPLFSEIKVKD